MVVFHKMEQNSGGDDFWSDDIVSESTPMRNYYRDKVIFVTGGTGFLGQIYVEKLLR